jgi:prepilin-type processing-associated H-X9-DG protein
VVNGGGGGGGGAGGNASGTGSLIPVNNGNVPVKVFLCPSRAHQGPLADYNYLQQATSVHFSAPFGATLQTITNANGASSTATVAHNGCNPQDYPSGPTAWYDCNQPSNAASVPDSQFPPGQMSQFFSSPHPGVNVVLFADGHARPITHGWLTANPSVWNWQNTSPLQLPD